MQNNLLPTIVSPHFLTICPHPFLMERINRLAPFGLSIQEVLDSIVDLPKDCATSIQVDGTPIHPDIWSSYYPSEGSPIAIRVVPMGGGDEGKNPLRMFLMLVVLVASFYVGGAFAVAWQGALASATVTMVGTLIVNALCPPSQARLTDRAGVNVDGVVNSITNARNQANPFGPIPVLLGSHRLVPFYGARSYTEIAGNDQYLRLLFVPCYTPVILSAFKIGETDLTDFEDVELEVKSLVADDDPSLYTNVIYEERVNVKLLEVNNWTTRTTQADTNEIIIDVVCPNGLFEFDGHGAKVPVTVYYEIQYAVKDSGNWIVLWNYLPIASHTQGPMRPFWQGDTIWRVLLNILTKETYVLEGRRGSKIPMYHVDIPPVAPPVPNGSCSLALIYFPMADGATPITDSMITDERSADCFDFEDPGDFLVVERGTPDDWVLISGGSYRLRPVLTGQTSEAVRKAVRIKISNGQYDVRLRRITADSADQLVYDDLYWSVLRSVTYESPTNVDNIALIAMRIKATDQLSGVIDTFNCIGTSICKDWDTDTSSWIERATANPASLYRYVLQHPSNKRAVADAKIDLTKLQEWHEFCQPTEISPNAGGPVVNKGGGKIGVPCTDHPFVTGQMIYMFGSVAYNGRAHVDEDTTANEIVVVTSYAPETFTGDETIHSIGLQYNSLIDYQSSISEILQQIAAAGMASPTYVDGKYSVVIDQVQTTPIQHFTPRNSWDFSGSKTYPRIPHALRVIFANRLTNWEIDERIVYADGYDVESATLFEQLELPGITDPELAYILGRYHLAVLILRPERYSFYADVENLVATRGDLIRVTHDVPLWGVATGRVKSFTTNATHVTAIVMDSVMTMVFGKSYSLRLRLHSGSSLLLAIDLNVGEQTTLVFTTPYPLVDIPDLDSELGDLGLFGETGEESVELLILSIEPGEDLTARITCIDYSPAVYTASTDLIGEHDSHITPPYGDVGRAGIPEIYQIRSDESVLRIDADGTLHTRIVLTLVPVGGYISKIAFTEVNWKIYETDAPWKIARYDGFKQEMSSVDIIEGAEYTIRLRFILHNGDSTLWTTEVQHTVIGKITPPGVPTNVSAIPVIGGIRLTWTNPLVADFQCTGFWKSESDVFPGGTAIYFAPGIPGATTSLVDRDVSYTVTYYYWLKSYDTTGNASSETSSVSGIPHYVHEDDLYDTIQSASYVAGISGWFIGFRGVDDGYAEFNNVTIRGALFTGEIHIPDKVTANSFHINTDGDAWWGCNEADFNSSPLNANAVIQNTGYVLFQGGLIAGFTVHTINGLHSGTGATRIQMKPDGGFWAGATIMGDAPFSVTNAGVLSAVSGTIGGFTLAATTLTATNLLLDAGNQKLILGTGNDIVALDAADATYRLAIGHATYSSAPFRVTKAGALTATAGVIGGWDIVSGYIYSLRNGTPTNTPIDGLVLASTNEAVIIYEDSVKRIELGYLTPGVYGLKGYDSGGSIVLFELSDTQNMIAGWTISQTTFANGTDIVLDAWHKKITINDTTFGNAGIQFEYNALNTPKAYIGDGLNAYFQFDGTKLTWKAANTELDASGNLNATSVTLTGAITATSGAIGGWVIGADYIRDVAGAVGMSSAVSGSDDIRFWAGHTTKASAPFSVTEAGVLLATSGTIGGWTLGATTLESANIIIDSGNNRIVSSNYVSGVFGAGFLLQSDLLEVGNIACRGIIRTAVFQKDVISAVGGNLVILTADILTVDMTTSDGDPRTRISEFGAVGDTRLAEDGDIRISEDEDTRVSEYSLPGDTRISEAGDTRVEDASGLGSITVEGNETFAIGDILRIKDGIDDEWLEVVLDEYAPEYYVLRDKAEDYAEDDNPAWTKGASVINYGASGRGAVYMTASESNAPYLSVFTHAGSPWDTVTTHLRIGNLNGYLGYATDIYGIAIGEATKYLKYDPTNGLRIRGNITSTSGSIGGWTLTATTIHNTNIWLDAGNKKIAINNNAFESAGIQLEYNAGSSRAYIGDGATKYLKFDGTNLSWRGVNASLTAGGLFTASNAVITGVITSESGTIGGWTLTASKLYNTNIWLDALAKQIAINSQTFGQDGIQLESNFGNARAYIGDGSNAFFQFDGTKVQWKGANSELDASGNIICTGGTIGGWTLGDTSLISTNIGLHSGTNAEILLGHATDYASASIGLKNDGSGKLANGNISWTIAGLLTATFVSGGSLTLDPGADITLVGADNNPGTLIFTGTTDVKVGLNAAGTSFEMVPTTDATTACTIGDHGVGIFGEDLRWSAFAIHSMSTFNITIYDSITDEDAYQCQIYGITNNSNSVVMLRTRFATVNYEALLTATGAIKAFHPNPTDTIDLGTPSYNWENLFVRCVEINTSPTVGKEALLIAQNDDNEPFIRFDGASEASANTNLSTWTVGAGLQGYIRINVGGQDFWIQLYSAPTS